MGIKLFQTFRFLFVCLSISFLLCGCGNADKSADNGVSINGVVADGLLKGAIVFLDMNGSLDPAGQPGTITAADGSYTLTGVSQSDLDTYPIVVKVPASAVDAERGQVQSVYFLETPPGKGGFISPLTTLIRRYMSVNGSTSEQAEAVVRQMIGLSPSANLFTSFVGKSDPDSLLMAKTSKVVVSAFTRNLRIIEQSQGAGISRTAEMRLIQDSIIGALAEIAARSATLPDNYTPDDETAISAIVGNHATVSETGLAQRLINASGFNTGMVYGHTLQFATTGNATISAVFKNVDVFTFSSTDGREGEGAWTVRPDGVLSLDYGNGRRTRFVLLQSNGGLYLVNAIHSDGSSDTNLTISVADGDSYIIPGDIYPPINDPAAFSKFLSEGKNGLTSQDGVAITITNIPMTSQYIIDSAGISPYWLLTDSRFEKVNILSGILANNVLTSNSDPDTRRFLAVTQCMDQYMVSIVFKKNATLLDSTVVIRQKDGQSINAASFEQVLGYFKPDVISGDGMPGGGNFLNFQNAAIQFLENGGVKFFKTNTDPNGETTSYSYHPEADTVWSYAGTGGVQTIRIPLNIKHRYLLDNKAAEIVLGIADGYVHKGYTYSPTGYLRWVLI